MTCFCEYELPQFIHIRMRKARKPHACTECGVTIQPGDTYEKVSGSWEGHIENFKTCARCLELREWVQAHVPCFCYGFGNVREEALEAAREWAHEAPGLLFGAYRREVAIRRAVRAQRQDKAA